MGQIGAGAGRSAILSRFAKTNCAKSNGITKRVLAAGVHTKGCALVAIEANR